MYIKMTAIRLKFIVAVASKLVMGLFELVVGATIGVLDSKMLMSTEGKFIMMVLDSRMLKFIRDMKFIIMVQGSKM